MEFSPLTMLENSINHLKWRTHPNQTCYFICHQTKVSQYEWEMNLTLFHQWIYTFKQNHDETDRMTCTHCLTRSVLWYSLIEWNIDLIMFLQMLDTPTSFKVTLQIHHRVWIIQQLIEIRYDTIYSSANVTPTDRCLHNMQIK